MKKIHFLMVAIVAVSIHSATYSAGLDMFKKITSAAKDTGIIDSESEASLNKAGNGISSVSSSIANVTEDITPEQQYYIGRAVAGTVLEKYKLYQNKDATAYVNKVCTAITQASDMPILYKGYYVGILDTEEVNAISTPGGHILVTRGLLECAKSEDALAAVIAHEIAHIQLGHSVKSIRSSRATNELVQAAQAGYNATMSNSQLLTGFSDSVDDIVNKVVNSGYSKTQEFQADKKALSLMSDAGYDPAAMQDMLSLLKEKEAGQTAGFCKTHPSAESRLKNIKQDLKKYRGDYKRTAREPRFTATKGNL